MEEQRKEERPFKQQLPLKVLSTSLGVALAANMFLVPGAHGETAEAPKLVEWSSDEVKTYFDPNLDWNIPVPAAEGQPQPTESPAPGAGGGSGGSAGGGTTVVHHYGGGFGWDDLLLYHLIFNRGGAYSSSAWSAGRPVYDYRTNQPYKPKSFDSTTFQNKTTANSNVKPKTSSTTGAFNSKGSTSRGGTSASSGSVSSGTAKSGTSSSGVSSSSSSSSSSVGKSSSSSSSSGKSTSSSSGSIGGKSSGFSSGGSSSGS